jgi:hypothetical protein
VHLNGIIVEERSIAGFGSLTLRKSKLQLIKTMKTMLEFLSNFRSVTILFGFLATFGLLFTPQLYLVGLPLKYMGVAFFAQTQFVWYEYLGALLATALSAVGYYEVIQQHRMGNPVWKL